MSRVPSYYATPNRLHSHEDMMRVLKERTKRKVAADGPSPGPGVLDGQSPRDNQATPSAGGGVQQGLPLAPAPPCTPRPAPLEWLPPTKDEILGTWSIKDASGRYTVLKERRSRIEGWQYLAFKGSAVLAPACASAECAKAHAQADWEKVR